MDEYVLQRDGCDIHYWIGGPEGRPLVVLTHGAAIDHREFEPQLPALTEEYRLLAWDVRSHGLSRPSRPGFSIRRAVEDIVALMDEAGYGQATLLGHSMGGNIGQEVVFHYPDRIQALAMLGCTCNTCKLSTLETLGVRMAPAILRLYPYELLKRQSAQASSVKPEVQQWLYQAFGQMTKEEFVAILTATILCLHYEPDYRITRPMLLAHGNGDRTGNIRKVAPRWAARDPNCHYVVIPEAGHAANLDNPGYFNNVLIEFLHANVPVAA